ncbi:YciI family protein [Phytoactinopolyspora limicola]|uniref:YciI family protein n=1 Tax=Phytoactinopolyspora limicola TaxID=2715536 RepID=UPI001407E13F|nr:YciI family protein [Phytoactinopolyspora limicola]
MRVMVFVKATPDYEAGTQELTEDEYAAMMRYNEELTRAGVLLATDGLYPSSKGARVEFTGERRTVVDGPFAETKELVAGFWLWQVTSMDEAIEWARRCPNPKGRDGTIEIRPVYERPDFEATLHADSAFPSAG